MQKLKLLLLLAFGCSLSLSYAQNSRETDSLALVALYNATGGENWKQNDNWLSSRPIEEWYGVEISKNSDRIYTLILPQNNLTGELPDDIAELDSVRAIVLSKNNLYGNIPPLHKIYHYDKLRKYHDLLTLPYDSVRKAKLDSLNFRALPSGQEHPLSFNYYQFPDIEKLPEAYAGSWEGNLGIRSAYTLVEHSNIFSKDTVVYLQGTESITLSFDYKTSPDIYFEWHKGSDIIAETSIPEYTIKPISDFTGDYICFIHRKDTSLFTKGSKPVQYSGTFRVLSAESKNLAPSINFSKTEISFDDLDWDFPKKYIEMTGDDFRALHIGAEDEDFTESLTFSLMRAPEHFQYYIQKGSAKVDYTESDFIQETAWKGEYRYLMHFKLIDKEWIGTDTLIFQVTDRQGLSSKDTFLLEVGTDPLHYSLPDFGGGKLLTYETDSGAWFKWENISKGIEQLDLNAYTVDVTLPCFANMGNRNYIFDTVLADFNVTDSLFIPALKRVKGKSIIGGVMATPVNRTGEGPGFYVNVELLDAPPVPYASSSIAATYFPVAQRLSLEYDVNGACFLTYLHIIKDGLAQEPVILFNKTNKTVDVEKGVKYQIYIATLYDTYSTDTVDFFLPLDPVSFEVDGSLQWDMQCRTKIDLQSIVSNLTDDFNILFQPNEFVDVLYEEGNVGLSSKKQQWGGNQKLYFSITGTERFQLDTFAIINHIETNSPISALSAEIKETILNEWKVIDLASAVSDVETDPADVNITVIDAGELKWKQTDDGFMVRPRQGTEGTDTLIVEFTDEGCASVQVSYIFTYTKEGDANNTGPVIDRNGILTQLRFDGSASQAFYADDPGSFPVVDLKQFVTDDKGVENVTLTWIPKVDKYYRYDRKNNEGVDISLESDTLRVLPKGDVFYGYEYRSAAGFYYAEEFSFHIIAEDEDGLRDTSIYLKIEVTERPMTKGEDKVFHFCDKNDTLFYDLFEDYRDEYPWIEEKAEILYNEVRGGQFFNAKIDDTGLFKTYSNGRINPFGGKQTYTFMPYFESSFQGDYYYSVTQDYYDGGTVELFDIVLIAHGSCDMETNFKTIPSQYLSKTATAQLNLWDYVEDNQPASTLFWEFTGGDNLIYEYDYDTGEFTAELKDPNWQSKDVVVVTVEDVYGKKTTAEIVFTTQEPIKTELIETGCGSFEYNGDILDETKEYTYTFKAENGADSIVILDLTIYPEYETQENKTVDYGETYQFGTQELKESGTYTETFKTVNGCDSIVELEFTVLDPLPVKTELTETACGEFDYNGDILDETKEYTYTYTAANGADSIVVLDLTIYPEYELKKSKTVAYGETYQFGTQELTVSGTYTETFQTVNGCDSIVELEFTVLDPNDIKTEITETACGEFEYNGDILDETKEYTYTFKAENGADSIVILDLTIYPEYEMSESKTVEYGETYQFGIQELTVSGTYTEIFQTVKGCDSIVELEFTVLDPLPVKTEITETACGAFEFNGDVLDETKEYTYTYTAANGADSIVILDLTIYPEYEMQENKTVDYGETYQFGTQELTKSGTYTETFQTVNGCDSIVELEFTVLDPNDIKTELTETACGAFEYNGDILDETKEYTYTFKAENGADSIVVLDLTIYPEYEIKKSITVEYGETFEFGGEELTASGTYSEIFKTVHGCDSIVELEFIVKENETPVITLTADQFEIPENSPEGTVLATVTATDAEGAVLRFTLEDESGAFEIDAESGIITVKDSSVLDYETIQELTITISVSDGELDIEKQLTVSLKDIVEVGVKNLDSAIKLYPVPVTAVLHIEATGIEGTYQILTESGVKVAEEKISNKAEINISNLPSGVYLFTLKSQGGIYKKAFVKK